LHPQAKNLRVFFCCLPAFLSIIVGRLLPLIEKRGEAPLHQPAGAMYFLKNSFCCSLHSVATPLKPFRFASTGISGGSPAEKRAILYIEVYL
jgi:hypothetical protein